MAEEIVSCPGCGKKFRIPEGAPGGTFQCTACEASVPYGKAAAGAAAQPARAGGAGRPSAASPAKSPAKGAAPVARAGKPEPRAGGRAAAGARAGKRGRGRREEPDEEAGGPRRRREKMSSATLFSIIGGVVLVGAVVAIAMSRKSAEEPAPKPAPGPTAPVAPTPAPTPVAPTPAPAPTTPEVKPEEGAKPGDASGIGGAQQAAGKGTYGGLFSSPGDQLFVRHPDLPGTTEAERAQMDKDVGLFADRDSGRAGTDARARLRKMGKKAIPSLVSVFEQHWKGTKWESEAERFASYQVQKLLADIVKADRPGGDFYAKYGPGIVVASADFERAARMWTAWWLGQGQTIETFKDFPE